MISRLIFNILAVCGMSMFAGFLLTVAVTLGGYWKTLPPETFLASFRQLYPFVIAALPFIGAPMLIGLGGAIWFSRREKAPRVLWLAASACVAVVFILTGVYFEPLNAHFLTGSTSLGQVASERDAWLLAHWLRVAFAALAPILAVIAVHRQSSPTVID